MSAKLADFLSLEETVRQSRQPPTPQEAAPAERVA
jgi:hypothetical protein